MNSPYLLLPTGVLLLFLYLLTLILSRISVIKLTTHRKIWNILLFLTFFVTAILGLILAIQVNYRIKIPFVKQLLTLHVDFGIAMTMIAVFHFLWHWNYYLALFKKRKRKEGIIEEKQVNVIMSQELQEEPAKTGMTAVLPIISLGFSAILAQIVLLREFLLLFNGNELICGLILANWMILTGTGAYFGKLKKNSGYSKNFIFFALILLGLIPPVTVFLLNNLKNIVFVPGIEIGLFQILYSSLIILIPFCMLSGFLFTYLAAKLSDDFKVNLIEKAYAYECIGSIIGGGLFSFLLVYFFSTFRILGILLFINVIIALSLALRSKLTIDKAVILIISLSFCITAFATDLDSFSKSALFKNQELIFLKDTPYGNLAITKTGDQKNFYENNVLLFTTDNMAENEEAVHYAMIQHPNPENVLLISGGISGITDEILKYDVLKIDYVEINPWIFRLGETYTESLKDERINTIDRDARLFLKKTSGKYDVVLINLPEPSTAQLNRYYTIEFFRELKKRLDKKAVISLSLPSTLNYISKEAARVNSVIYATLKKAFKDVIIIPGERNYFIASNSKLNINIVKLIDEKGIDNIYVNRYYMDDALLKQRSDYILSNLVQDIDINKDFRPVSYFNQLIYWISQFKIDLRILLIVCVIIFTGLIILITRLNHVNLGMFIAGYTAASVEVILIVAFQIIYGYVYHTLGIIVTIFMAGLSLGALTRRKLFPRPAVNHYILLQFALGIFTVILPFIILFANKLSVFTELVHIIFLLLTMIVSYIVGLVFSMATLLQKEGISSISAKVYSIDLVGSALGALIISVLLIPLTGIIYACLIMAVLNFLAAFFSLSKMKSIYPV